MHLSEFKAWFLGFTEEMKQPPNKAQWEKIKKRVSEITADFTPATIFVDRYVYPYRHWWPYGTGWASSSVISSCASSNNVKFFSANSSVQLSDWSAAGRAEYLAT